MTYHDQPILSFGVIADPQYADIEPRLDFARHYRQSLGKLDHAIDSFNARSDLEFVITLGDVIDRHIESYDAIMPRYEALRHEALFIAGNHDFSVKPEELDQVFSRLQMPQPYYAISRSGLRFILLDGNEVSLFSRPKGDALREESKRVLARLEQEQSPNAQRWNGGLSDRQFAWLAAQIEEAKDAGERVVIFCHYPIHPLNSHNLWDYQRICQLIEGQSHVIAWMNGHNHAGNYAKLGSCHCVNFIGMVDTIDQNAFAIVTLYPEKIMVEGFGRELSRSLPLGQ